jgi:tRNA nucleotidyltransferase/poly(A) polymerase
MKLNYIPSDIFLVGGSVRDFLLKKKINDYDFVLKTNEWDFLDKARDFLGKNFNKNGFLIGKVFPPTIRAVLENGTVVDITLMQEDFYEDALRRDFTINSLFFDLKSEKIIDPLNGAKDIFSGKIKITTKNSFIDDPLRMLRGIRLLGQLNGFTLDKATYMLIKHCKTLIKNVAAERVRDEIEKIFLFKKRFFLLKYLLTTELLFEIFPEMKLIENLPQRDVHMFDVLNHSLNILRFIPDYENAFNKKIYCYTALFHDIGKFDDMHRHTEFSVKYSRKILSRLKFPKKSFKLILSVIENHMKILQISLNKVKEDTLKKFVFQHYEIMDYLINFTLMETKTKKRTDDNIFYVCQRLKFLKEDFQKKKNFIYSLITGKDLIESGIRGERIGELIGKIRFLIYRDNIKTKEEALRILKGLM